MRVKSQTLGSWQHIRASSIQARFQGFELGCCGPRTESRGRERWVWVNDSLAKGREERRGSIGWKRRLWTGLRREWKRDHERLKGLNKSEGRAAGWGTIKHEKMRGKGKVKEKGTREIGRKRLNEIERHIKSEGLQRRWCCIDKKRRKRRTIACMGRRWSFTIPSDSPRAGRWKGEETTWGAATNAEDYEGLKTWRAADKADRGWVWKAEGKDSKAEIKKLPEKYYRVWTKYNENNNITGAKHTKDKGKKSYNFRPMSEEDG